MNAQPPAFWPRYANRLIYGGHTVHVGAQHWIALYPQTHDAKPCCATPTMAMYHAKQGGRNRWRSCPGMAKNVFTISSRVCSRGLGRSAALQILAIASAMSVVLRLAAHPDPHPAPLRAEIVNTF